MENYLTIKEFADFVGISTQAVYQRLDKDLKDYYEVIDNKKYLKKSVLSLFRDNVQKNVTTEQNTDLLNFLKAENEGLLNQVNEKDNALQVALKDKNLLLQQVNKLRLELDNLKQEKENLILENDSLKKEVDNLLEINENLKTQIISQSVVEEVSQSTNINDITDNTTIIEENISHEPTSKKDTQHDILPQTINVVESIPVDTNAELLKEREETILQLQESLAKALQSTAELESQLSKEKENINEKDSQILNKEKRLDEKENTIRQLLSQLQQAQEHSQYMSTQLAKANESLSEATFKAQELTQNQQILMKQQQDNQILLASHSQPKGLLERIFGKK